MKKMPKLLRIALLVLCFTLFLTAAAAAGTSKAVYMIVNGIPLQSAEAYINENGITMVPLRAVAEALGFGVSWNPDSRTVSITSEEFSPRPVVMLDPGHGGSSPGAVYDGVMEKDLDLAIAKKAREMLEEAGILVLMTRAGDDYVDLYDRTALAAGWCADMIVSIHCNASENNPNALGIYTAAFSKNTESWTLADTLRKSVIASTGAENMGTAERPNLVVLRTATMPAALVECGYMSTPSELAQLVQPEYQTQLARGIADGILAVLDWTPPESSDANMDDNDDNSDEIDEIDENSEDFADSSEESQFSE